MWEEGRLAFERLQQRLPRRGGGRRAVTRPRLTSRWVSAPSHRRSSVHTHTPCSTGSFHGPEGARACCPTDMFSVNLLPEDVSDRHAFTMTVEYRGFGRYGVFRDELCSLSADGEWSWEYAWPGGDRELATDAEWDDYHAGRDAWIAYHRFNLETAPAWRAGCSTRSGHEHHRHADAHQLRRGAGAAQPSELRWGVGAEYSSASRRACFGSSAVLAGRSRPRLGVGIPSRSPVPSSVSPSCCTGCPSCATVCARGSVPHSSTPTARPPVAA